MHTKSFGEQDFGEEAGVPDGHASLHDGAVLFARMLFDQTQSESTEPGQVLGGVSVSCTTFGLAERHVHASVGRYSRCSSGRELIGEDVHITLQDGDVILHVAAFDATGLSRANDQAEHPQAFPLLQTTQRLRHVHLVIPPLLDATMTRLARFLATHFHGSEVILQVRFQQRLHVLFQQPLVAFHWQHVVAAFVDDLSGDRRLSAHRVDADARVFDVHQNQQQRARSDLVGLLRCCDLPQSQALLAGPDTHQMQRSELMPSIMRPPQRLVVDAEKICPCRTDQRIGLLGKALLKRLRVQLHQHTSDAVFRRDSVRQVQIPDQPVI